MQCLEAQDLLDRAFDATPCLMSISTIPEGRYIKVNKCFEEYTGYTAQEAMGCTPTELRIFSKTAYGKLLALFKKRGSFRNVVSSYTARDGTVRMGLFSAERITYCGHDYVLTVANEITEQKKLEDEVTKLERMNTVAQMAATVAHEVRNPLTCVRGFLQLLGQREELNLFQDQIKIMLDELDRANKIMTQFLMLSKTKGKATVLKMNNLNSIIHEIEPLINVNGFHTNGTADYELNPLPEIFLNKEEIRQLILNLTRNAFESMPHGGTVKVHTYTDGERVFLSVKDQGTGMDPAVLKQLGTPFFTTKEKGTGLGLAVCYAIAENHSAKVLIESDTNGTEVTVAFKI